MYYYIYLYLEAAVGTVFEIATFPWAKILHSRSIKMGFSVFEKKIKKNIFLEKNAKMVFFCFVPITCHLVDIKT